MNVGKLLSYSGPSFRAKVIIKAPEKLLKTEDKNYFESLGSYIGDESDTFEIIISDLKQSDLNPSVLIYQCSQKYISKNNKQAISSSTKVIPYVKDGHIMEDKFPKVYLQRIFDRLIKK